MAARERAVADVVLETAQSTVVDLVDHLLNKGVTATGDVTLGVAGVDLIYLRLSALLCAVDRVLPASAKASAGNRGSDDRDAKPRVRSIKAAVKRKRGRRSR